MKSPRLLYLLLFLTLLSCKANDDQRNFERSAYRPASLYTQTNNQGDIVSLDEDDWRISPLFQGLIDIKPPFPNPASIGSPINFEINIVGIQSVEGLDIQIRYPNDRWNSLYLSLDNPLPAGISSFQLDPILLGQYNTAESARGLNRIYLFDTNQRMISYGDILVE